MRKKSIVLVVVMGMLVVLTTLAWAALFIMTQESRIAEHKIKRMRAFFAAHAGIVHAIDELAMDATWSGATINVGSGVGGYPSGGLPAAISIAAGAGPGGSNEITIVVTY